MLVVFACTMLVLVRVTTLPPLPLPPVGTGVIDWFAVHVLLEFTEYGWFVGVASSTQPLVVMVDSHSGSGTGTVKGKGTSRLCALRLLPRLVLMVVVIVLTITRPVPLCEGEGLGLGVTITVYVRVELQEVAGVLPVAARTEAVVRMVELPIVTVLVRVDQMLWALPGTGLVVFGEIETSGILDEVLDSEVEDSVLELTSRSVMTVELVSVRE
ncbi:hypothetical protein F5B20DRAFT_428320 [Whalleya microplaca]|nr:hypothetical protein F5B20DRAFT_428320 [Whalleya microplaca]